MFAFEKGITGKDNTDSINLRLDRTMQVKQALLEKANLSSTVRAFFFHSFLFISLELGWVNEEQRYSK